MNKQLLQVFPSVIVSAFVRTERHDFGIRRERSTNLFAGIRCIGRALAKIRRRRAAMAELRAFPDHRLADIGIDRARIPDVVDAMLELEQDRLRTGSCPKQ